MRAHALLVVVMVAGAAPLRAQSITPAIQLADHSGQSSGMTNPGAGGEPMHVMVTYNVPVEVRLVGVTSGDKLFLRQPDGTAAVLTVRCEWLDYDEHGPDRRWISFPCYAAGLAAPPAPLPGTVRRVLLRTYAIANPGDLSGAGAGRYESTAYFRVDAR